MFEREERAEGGKKRVVDRKVLPFCLERLLTNPEPFLSFSSLSFSLSARSSLSFHLRAEQNAIATLTVDLSLSDI